MARTAAAEEDEGVCFAASRASASARAVVASSNVPSLRHRLMTFRTPGRCSGGHRSAAERHVSTSGASLPAYVRAASGSSARVVSALRTYSTGTLCRGFFAWICFTRIVTACL